MSKIPIGISQYNINLPSRMGSIIITNTSEKFTAETIESFESWTTKIQDDNNIYIPAGIVDYEVTTDDSTINTSGKGKKYYQKSSFASMSASLESNNCDHNTAIQKLNTNIYRLLLVLEDGSIYGSVNSKGEHVGFLCEITAVSGGIPLVGETHEDYQIYVNFKSIEEFENVFTQCVTFSSRELAELMPIGVTIKCNSNYFLFEDYSVFKAFIPCIVQMEEIQPSDIEIVSNFLQSGQNLVITIVTYNENTKFLELVAEDALGDILQEGDIFIIKIKSSEYRSDQFTVIVKNSSFGGSFSNDFSNDLNIGFQNITTC